jgi:hypothetical protein
MIDPYNHMVVSDDYGVKTEKDESTKGAHYRIRLDRVNPPHAGTECIGFNNCGEGNVISFCNYIALSFYSWEIRRIIMI